ncbi:hypothetical protein [Arthrobacter sp. MMS18-M83]|uniref:hypothetical protein n=1 Tax=Arthrobacter sp. MMS18-M83 TaxID=2996261 RepID=UPI00227A0C2D|nr:hypothetical protein [Arthrobacter sp. MMS18-M83]WAH99181.1 hypothetical protein OW521_10320 [Arthrobacter sp. MMS18-M83]
MNSIDARIGRQLIVDDHLLEHRSLVRTWLPPAPSAGNPVLAPSTDRDMNGGRCPVAAPFDDGILYDHEIRKWRVWYMSGWFDRTSLRNSVDGIVWNDSEPKELTGLDYEEGGGILQRDGVSICRDYADAEAKYRMLRWVRRRTPDFGPEDLPAHSTPVISEGGEIYSSDDGEHWVHEGPSGPCGDNTTFFYDPFRRKWVFSLRTHLGPYGRGRGWHEADDFHGASRWSEGDVLPWVGSHGFGAAPPVGDLRTPEIYKITCMPYESAMLGVFAVYRGPSNDYAEAHGLPKIIDLYLGISRDGYHYNVNPEPFLASSLVPDAWDYGYLHMVNGGIIPCGDETRIYYTGFSGVSPSLGRHMYAGASMGLATLRRDGFCALTPGPDGAGAVQTRPLLVQGDHLFINIRTGAGEAEATVTDLDAGGTETHAIPSGVDNTRHGILLAGTTGRNPRHVTVTIRLSADAHLYSFWFSDESGNSGGYSAGGPITWD